VNHKSSLQGIPLQRPAFRQIQLQQNAVSGFQINGLGILHGRRGNVRLESGMRTKADVRRPL